MAVAAAAVLCLLPAVDGGEAYGVSDRPGDVHTLIVTECSKYQDWQSIAAAFAWRESEQPGKVTRVVNCNAKDSAAYREDIKGIMRTHMAPQYAWNERTKDWYAAYNKPGAIVDWFAKSEVKEEWVLVLDSDMLLRTGFRGSEFNLTRGWAMAAHYDYLHGVNNELAERHVPDIEPRKDTLAGPKGRRGDRVGGPYFMHREDLKRLAPLWLNYTERVREDMEAYRWAGDTSAKKGDKIWIAEMYGYSFGAAKADVWHRLDNTFMIYPGYSADRIPRTIHYGLVYHVGTWAYDKHWYFNFDPYICPPWDLTVEKPQSGIFPPPPKPSEIESKDLIARYRDLIAVQTIALVNAALCEWHVRRCPPSEQLTKVCDEAAALYSSIKEEVLDIEWNWQCANHNKECEMWAKRGECNNSKQYMEDHCGPACGFCKPKPPRPRADQASSPAAGAVAAAASPAGDAKAGGGAVEANTTAGGASEANTTAGTGQETYIGEMPKQDKQQQTQANLHDDKAQDVQGGGGDSGDSGAGGGTQQQKQDQPQQQQQQQQQQEGEQKNGESAQQQQPKADVATQQQAASSPDTLGKEAGSPEASHAEPADAAGSVGAKADEEPEQQQQHPVHPTKDQSTAKGGAGDGGGVVQHASADQQAAIADERELRAQHPASDLSYAALVKRCTDFKGLLDTEFKECVQAAALRLAYEPKRALDLGGDAVDSAANGSNAAGHPGELGEVVAHASGADGTMHGLIAGRYGRRTYDEVMSLSADPRARGEALGVAAAVLAGAGLGVWRYRRGRAMRGYTKLGRTE